jgi:GNAT superfamily N-acetyltransferase/2'-5' RNA ligase
MIRFVAVGTDAPAGQLHDVRMLMSEYAALPHTNGRWPTMREDLAMLPQPFVKPEGVLLLALADGIPVGCGALRVFEPGVGEIKRMYVRPTARGRGVGSQLLTALLAQAAAMGFGRVRLDTAPELTEALALYRRFGFTAIPPYRAGLLADALCFERPVPHVTHRTQLSLFVPPEAGDAIDAIRRVVDPVQHRLIPAHVTLCREDELHEVDVAQLASRLRDARLGRLTLRFGAPQRFGGHGILLPCIDGAEAFVALRRAVLALPEARVHTPHLTLAHPRNPKADGNELDRAATLEEGLCVTFDAVQVIDQFDADPWVVRSTFPLAATAGWVA